MSAFSSVSLISSSSSCLFRSTKEAQSHVRFLKLRASLNQTQTSPLVFIQHCAKAAIFLTAAATLSFKSSHFHARAQTPSSLVHQNFTQFDSELLHDKLRNGQDAEALAILRRLVAEQPEQRQWMLMLARVLDDRGDTESARQVLEEYLEANPLCSEALLENAVLMDENGEPEEAVMERLHAALSLAEQQNMAKEARDVRLIMAHLRFLQDNMDEAINLYNQLTEEDPSDFRPYFCRSVVYSWMGSNADAAQQFAKYQELSPYDFDIQGYLSTPLSRMMLFGTHDDH